MRRSIVRYAWLLVVIVMQSNGLSQAQDSQVLPEQYREAIPLYPEVIGPYTFAISSDNEEARKFFRQGMQLMYAFAKVDAVRSFRESWNNDPLSLIHISEPTRPY